MARRRVARPPQEVSFWPFGGMIAMVSVLFLYGASALVAPWWVVVLLVLLWVAMFLQCCRWWSTHPKRILGTAVFAAVLWFATLVGGAAWLGWSA